MTLDDDEKDFYAVDAITSGSTANVEFPAGNYTSVLNAEVDTNSGEQIFGMEVYLTSADGTPIDSPNLTSPVGDLGVRVLAILQSGIIDLQNSNPSQVTLSGDLPTAIPLAIGQRIRFHFFAEKSGTQGGVVDLSIYFGNERNSYVNRPVFIDSNGVINLSTIPGDNTTQALNNLILTADNGLTKTGTNNVKLGGALTSPTTISTGANKLFLDAGFGGNLEISTRQGGNFLLDVSQSAGGVINVGNSFKMSSSTYVEEYGGQTITKTFPEHTTTEASDNYSIDFNSGFGNQLIRTLSPYVDVMQAFNPGGDSTQYSMEAGILTQQVTDSTGGVGEIKLDINNGLIATNSINDRGIQYSQTQTSGWTDQTLVTKKYVDDNSGGGTGTTYSFENGLTNSSGTVRLGGILQGSTSLLGGGENKNFEIGAATLSDRFLNVKTYTTYGETLYGADGTGNLARIFGDPGQGGITVTDGGINTSTTNVSAGIAQLTSTNGTSSSVISTEADNAAFNVSDGVGGAGTIIIRDDGSWSIATNYNEGGSLVAHVDGADANRTIFTDQNPIKKGIEYSGDYSGTFEENSLVTKRYVDTETLKPKVEELTTTNSLSPNANSYEAIQINSLSENLSINTPIGGYNGSKLTIRIKDDGTVRGLAWTSNYRVVGTVLPGSTVAGKVLYVGAIYSFDDNKWDVVSVAQEL